MSGNWMFLLGAASVLCHQPTAMLMLGPDGLTLSGAWILNENLSDRATSVPASPIRTAEGGGGPRTRGTHASPSSEQLEAIKAVLVEVLDPPIRLAIAEKDTAVVFVYGDGRSQRFGTTNAREKHHFNYGPAATKTRWDGGTLIMESSFENGLTVIETYAVTSNPRQMHVTVRAENWRMPQPLSVHRVYDDELDR